MSSPDKTKSRLFLNELAQFYRSKGQMGVTPQHLIARLDGQEVDLCHLYSAVLEMGGSYRVNQQSQWDQVYARLFGSSPDHRSVIGVNVSVALRQIYQRYLMPYEKVHYSNFAHDVADEDEDESRSNFISSMAGSSGKDSAASFVIHSSLTQPQPPQKHAHHVDPLTRLFCALVSGLANEMEFGLKIVTMLANSRQIDAIADLKLVDVLLECCSLSLCHCRTYDDQQHQQSQSIRANLSNCSLQQQHQIQQQQNQQLSEKKCVCQSRFWSKKCKDESIAALLLDDLPDDCIPVLADDEDDRDQKLTEKVKRIADLIRTITESIQEYQESDEEVQSEAAPPRLVQFAGLLLSSDDSEFKSLALEIISNINLIGSQSRDDEFTAALVNSIICHCIRLVTDDNDLAIVRCSIRTLAHIAALAADEPNNAFEQLIDESQIISRMIELLTCQQDVSLLTATLEFCWTISENRPKLLTRNTQRVNQLLKILINLLNCEANSHFTPQALKHVRVRDMRNRSQVRVTQNAAAQPSNAIPQQMVRVAVQPAGSPNNSAILSESESFAISWLKGLYESSARSQSVSISEMYTEYIKTSCKSGRKNVVGAQSFSQIIARTFPSASITSSHMVEGLALRPVTPRKPQNTPQGQQLTSPILKAHLCAPPKTSPTSTMSATSLTSSTAPSHNSPNGATTTTTLIKSLLANKLRGNSQTNSLKSESSDSPGSVQGKAAATRTTAEGLVSHPVTSSSTSVAVVSNQSILTSSTHQSVLISTPSAGGAGLPGQGPQQFLLVRTIVPGSNQTSGMRLILPASVITQQRPAAPPAVTVNGNGLPSASPPVAGHSNDILLKAVLGSGIVSEAAPASNADGSNVSKKCVKSSPLLNVLLDKGKFPESSATLTTSATAGSQTQSHDRVYILTTGSPLKSANFPNDTSPLRNGTAGDSGSAAVPMPKPSAIVVNSHTDSPLTNGDISGYHHNEEKKSNAMPIADLSPIKDIQKAVDDAPKLISKRPADTESDSQTPSKKNKIADVSDPISRDTVKAVTKILPVNGEVRLPPKVSPEKVSPDVSRTAPVPTASPAPAVIEYLCEWHECKRSFSRASHVFKHVYESHVFSGDAPKHCLWGGSEGMGPGCLSERPQLSLLTHLQDFHCSPSILQQAALKRQQFGNTITAAPVMPVPAPPAHPGYAQNAALLAIRRLNCIEPFTVPAATPTTPITVSIRLTAALIIRNVATISSDARRFLQRYERFLSEMCVAPGRDESRTIAQCLALIQNVIWRR